MGAILKLTPLESKLLALLQSRPLVTRDAALDELYADRREPDALTAIDVHLYRLRRKISAPIRNHYGVGWSMVADNASR